ncbi:MAG: zinc-binding alcohol dehydrogenase family protein [Haloferacaceae archaeon]
MRVVEATAHGDPSVLSVGEASRPAPDAGEVRIAVERAGVNFADVEKRRGRYPDAPTPPYVPGIEVAGRIDAVGPGVDRQRGERVAAILDGGGYAEYAVAAADVLFDLPAGVDPAAAAGIPVQFTTAHNALFEWGDLSSGERVLVHAAAGGVGTAAVQLAADAGATVFGTASTAEKLSLAVDLGVDHPIDYTGTDVAARVEEITGGRGVDLVLDGVGGEAFYAGLDALADCGRIVAYGMASGSVPTVSTPRLLFENQAVLGYHLGHALDHAPKRVRAGMDRLVDRFEAGAVEVVIGREFPLADAAGAHRAVEARETTGKVLLAPDA